MSVYYDILYKDTSFIYKLRCNDVYIIYYIIIITASKANLRC